MNIENTVPADAIDITFHDDERCVLYFYQINPHDHELYSIAVCEDNVNVKPLAIDDAEALKFFNDAIEKYEHDTAGDFYG